MGVVVIPYFTVTVGVSESDIGFDVYVGIADGVVEVSEGYTDGVILLLTVGVGVCFRTLCGKFLAPTPTINDNNAAISTAICIYRIIGLFVPSVNYTNNHSHAHTGRRYSCADIGLDDGSDRWVNGFIQ